jgi:hypothetical protein
MSWQWPYLVLPTSPVHCATLWVNQTLPAPFHFASLPTPCLLSSLWGQVRGAWWAKKQKGTRCVEATIPLFLILGCSQKPHIQIRGQKPIQSRDGHRNPVSLQRVPPVGLSSPSHPCSTPTQGGLCLAKG